MAILVQDVYNTPSGVTLQNFVVTTKGNIVKIEKIGTNSYRVVYEVYYYISETFYSESKPYVHKELKTIILSDCSNNIYQCIYDSVKSGYQNYQNI
jgi:hypothetical protein